MRFMFSGMANKRILVELFEGAGLTSTSKNGYGMSRQPPVIILLFEEIGLENKLIFLYILKTKSRKLFKKFVVHKICHIKRAFSSQFFNGSRIHVANDQV